MGVFRRPSAQQLMAMAPHARVAATAIFTACASICVLLAARARQLQRSRDAKLQQIRLPEQQATPDSDLSALPDDLWKEVLRQVAASASAMELVEHSLTCKSFREYFAAVARSRCAALKPGLQERLKGIASSPFVALRLAQDLESKRAVTEAADRLARQRQRQPNEAETAAQIAAGFGNLVMTSASQPLPNQSHMLCRNLIRMFFSQLVYARGCFEDGCFDKQSVGRGYGEGIALYSLGASGSCPRAARSVIRWVEGLLEAVSRGYLQTALLLMSEDAEAMVVLEAHALSLLHIDEGPGVSYSILFLRTGGARLRWLLLNTHERYTKSYVSDATVRLLRLMLQSLATLPDLPPKHHLSMRLSYVDGTPTDYEPDGFQPVHVQPVLKPGEALRSGPQRACSVGV